MDKYQSFALAQWLANYPDEMGYEDVLGAIRDESDEVIVWEAAEDFPISQLIEVIKETEQAARSWFDEPRTITVTWSVLDVLSVRPDLSKDEAWEVLQLIRKDHSANIGINWEVIESFADFLFPKVES